MTVQPALAADARRVPPDGARTVAPPGAAPPAAAAAAVAAPPAEGDAGALHVLGAGLPLPRGAFVALVPGAAAVLMPVDLPARLRGTAREAVALRQVCDRLDADPATLDLRPARFRGREADWSAVLVADRAAAAAWRAEVAPARGRVRAILPDYLALPAAAGLWTVAAAGGSVAVRLGPWDGFAAEPALAALALERALAEGPPPRAVLRLGEAAPAVDAILAARPDFPCTADPRGLPAGIGPPRRFAHGELALDLGRDPRALAARIAGQLRRLAVALVLAAAGLGAWVAAEGVEADRLEAEAAARRAALAEAARRDFGLSGPILDVAVQVTREIERRRRAAEAGPATGPLDLLRRAGIVLAFSEAELAGVALRPDGGLALELELAGFAELEALTEELAAEALAVAVERSVAAAGGRVAATLLLRPGG